MSAVRADGRRVSAWIDPATGRLRTRRDLVAELSSTGRLHDDECGTIRLVSDGNGSWVAPAVDDPIDPIIWRATLYVDGVEGWSSQ